MVCSLNVITAQKFNLQSMLVAINVDDLFLVIRFFAQWKCVEAVFFIILCQQYDTLWHRVAAMLKIILVGVFLKLKRKKELL